jgi:2'-5' RNA ligase
MTGERFAFSIPFRDLAPAVDVWRERTCGSKPSHGVPPHVTLLIPVPPDVDSAAEALASFGAFDVTFARLDRFPGTLWLAPEPSEPFGEMTNALMERFPEHAPYGGGFEGITPHLTVAQGDDLAEAEDAIAPLLPLRSRASSIVLFQQVAADRWLEKDELPL